MLDDGEYVDQVYGGKLTVSGKKITSGSVQSGKVATGTGADDAPTHADLPCGKLAGVFVRVGVGIMRFDPSHELVVAHAIALQAADAACGSILKSRTSTSSAMRWKATLNIFVTARAVLGAVRQDCVIIRRILIKLIRKLDMLRCVITETIDAGSNGTHEAGITSISLPEPASAIRSSVRKPRSRR